MKVSDPGNPQEILRSYDREDLPLPSLRMSGSEKLWLKWLEDGGRHFLQMSIGLTKIKDVWRALGLRSEQVFKVDLFDKTVFQVLQVSWWSIAKDSQSCRSSDISDQLARFHLRPPDLAAFRLQFSRPGRPWKKTAMKHAAICRDFLGNSWKFWISSAKPKVSRPD